MSASFCRCFLKLVDELDLSLALGTFRLAPGGATVGLRWNWRGAGIASGLEGVTAAAATPSSKLCSNDALSKESPTETVENWDSLLQA